MELGLKGWGGGERRTAQTLGGVGVCDEKLRATGLGLGIMG